MKLHILRDWQSAKVLGSSFNRSSDSHGRAELGKTPSVENPVDFCFFHGIHLNGVRKTELPLYPSLGVWFTSTEPLQMSLESYGFKSVQQDTDHSGPCPGKRLNTCWSETMPLVPSWAEWDFSAASGPGEHIWGTHSAAWTVTLLGTGRAAMQSQLGLSLMMHMYIIQHNGATTYPNNYTRAYRACIRRTLFELRCKSTQK